jgi:DNA-binding GntR family transcriptional regulator
MEPLSLVPNLIEQVHARLVDAIAERLLPPGERLTQDEIAQRFAVSRQPVSHALHLLRQQGLVVEQGKRGLAVAPVDPMHMRQLYELRAAIDGLAASLAAGRVGSGYAPPRHVSALREALASGRALLPDAPMHDWIATDVAFHSAVYALSGNPTIAETVAGQWPHFKRCMGTAMSDPVTRDAVWSEHGAIAGAILAGLPEAAAKAAGHHADKAGRLLFQRLTAEADAA